MQAPEHALAALNAGAGVAALGGSWYAVGGAPDWPLEWLEGSPFRDYTVPGLVLGGVYAPASFLAAWAVWRRHPRADSIALATASFQIAWIAVQLRIIGYRSFLQPAMAAVGVANLSLAWRLRRRRR